jgi:hypothetical protein
MRPGKEYKMKRAIILSMAAASLAMLALGCGSKTTTIAPGGKMTVNRSVTGQVKDMKVETKEGSGTVKLGSGKAVTEAELGVPVYPGAVEMMSGELKGSKMMNTPGYDQHVITTDDDIEKVKAFYKSNLKNAMNQDMTQGNKKMSMFMVDQGAIMVHITANPEKKKTIIMVMKKK